MKRITSYKLFLAVFICVLVACEHTDIQTYTEPSVVTSSSIRSQEEALQIAENAISIITNDANITRAASSNWSISNPHKPIIIKGKATRSGNTSFNSDTLLYIFNYENEKGFAVISANRSTEALIAVSDSGNISSIDEITNPGLAFFMRAAENYVSTCEDTITEDMGRKHVGELVVHDTISSSYISPKVEVKWNAGSVEGDECPNKKAGCAAIATFQAMSYFEFPRRMDITYTGRTMDSINLNVVQWMNIKMHTSSSCYVCSEDRHKMISTICRDICEKCQSVFHCNTGTRSSIVYDSLGETSTTFPNMRNAFLYYGFSASSINHYSANTVRNNLNANNLIIMAGNSDYSPRDHAWIVDGYRYYLVNHKFYKIDGNIRTLMDSGYETLNICHINWGWGGIGNGYYNDNVFSLNNYRSIDNGCPSYYGNEGFSNVQYFIISR